MTERRPGLSPVGQWLKYGEIAALDDAGNLRHLAPCPRVADLLTPEEREWYAAQDGECLPFDPSEVTTLHRKYRAIIDRLAPKPEKP